MYKRAMSAAMAIFRTTRTFPAEERYSLTDQIRRSSRSVCSNLAEAWRKRQYRAAFVAKMSDCVAEADETLVWLEFAAKCGYLSAADAEALSDQYDRIIAQLVSMSQHPEQWTITRR